MEQILKQIALYPVRFVEMVVAYPLPEWAFPYVLGLLPWAVVALALVALFCTRRRALRVLGAVLLVLALPLAFLTLVAASLEFSCGYPQPFGVGWMIVWATLACPVPAIVIRRLQLRQAAAQDSTCDGGPTGGNP